MLANVQQTTIQPIIEATVAEGTRIHTDEYGVYARLGAVAGVVGNLGGVVSGLFNEPRPALARRRRPRHGQG